MLKKLGAALLSAVIVCTALPFLNSRDPILAFSSFFDAASIISRPLVDTFNGMFGDYQVTNIDESTLTENFVYRVTRSSSVTQGKVTFDRVGHDGIYERGSLSFRYDGSVGYDWFFGSGFFDFTDFSDPFRHFEIFDIFDLTSKQPAAFYQCFPRAVFGDYDWHKFSLDHSELTIYFTTPRVLSSPSEWQTIITFDLDPQQLSYLVYINKQTLEVTVIEGV